MKGAPLKTTSTFRSPSMGRKRRSEGSLESNLAGDLPPPENLAAKHEVPRRYFGKTKVVVSAMALGGATFAGAKTKAESIRIVQEAVDNGITFMDNAWDYNEGR